jgi:hypothetical protein
MKKIFLTIVFFSLTFFSFAQTMTIDMLWKLGRLSIDNLGPDGKSVFYGITYYNVQANKGVRNLYSMNIKSGTAVKLTNTYVSKSNATLTPMGKLGYIQDGQWYEANADGSKPKQLTNFPERDFFAEIFSGRQSCLICDERKNGQHHAGLLSRFG